MKKFIIKSVEPASIGEELEIMPGDTLLRINGQDLADILDYRYLIANEEVILEIEKNNQEIWELDIEKEFEDDLGLHFKEDIIETKTCKNNCIFCFIDQLPKGLRSSLYVKDDDERLSFLTGNYITLTNLTEKERDRIIDYRIMPINLSIHTTNPSLRRKMLNNRFAGNVKEYLDLFKEHQILMNGQIVLVPAYNDERELITTLDDLKTYFPVMQSVSIVPVGISAHCQGLVKLEPFNQKSASKTIEIINKVHFEMRKKHGHGFVYPSDEFFLLADLPIPDVTYYDGFSQIENGVGMIADFRHDFYQALEKNRSLSRIRKIGIITGIAAQSEIDRLVRAFSDKYPKADILILPVVNHFFGNKITVSGLITGQDIIDQVLPQLQKSPRDLLLIPENAFKQDSEILLDDHTLASLSKTLATPLIKTPVNGQSFFKALLQDQ